MARLDGLLLVASIIEGVGVARRRASYQSMCACLQGGPTKCKQMASCSLVLLRKGSLLACSSTTDNLKIYEDLFASAILQPVIVFIFDHLVKYDMCETSYLFIEVKHS